MNTQPGNSHLHNVWGEIALITAVTINSFGVVLMLYSAAGISAISSVPYAFSLVLPRCGSESSQLHCLGESSTL